MKQLDCPGRRRKDCRPVQKSQAQQVIQVLSLKHNKSPKSKERPVKPGLVEPTNGSLILTKGKTLYKPGITAWSVISPDCSGVSRCQPLRAQRGARESRLANASPHLLH
jgi:hypothetical protein